MGRLSRFMKASATSKPLPPLDHLRDLLQKHPDLLEVVVHWTNLPEHVRKGILALVEAGRPK